MCAQTIFRAMDFLTAWVVEKSKRSVANKGKGGAQSGMLTIIRTYGQIKDFNTYSYLFMSSSEQEKQEQHNTDYEIKPYISCVTIYLKQSFTCTICHNVV